MTLRFADCELDEERFELRRQGRPVEIEPKALEVLRVLVRNAGRAVSQRELLDAVWPDAVVTQGSLARAVSLARVAIGDRERSAPWIVTVARRGYRFEAPDVAAGSATSRYIGRAALIERLAARLDAALAGDGGILFLAGEAGIGKTRTAELLAERARRRGARVMAAWTVEEDAPTTYSSWMRVLRALAAGAAPAVAALSPPQRSALARLVPELLPQPDGERTSGWRSDDSERIALYEAVAAFVCAAARAVPLALVLDDLHGSDAESVALLEFVGRALPGQRVAILVTCREEDARCAPRQARAIERLLRLTSVERWPLAGLAADEVREFVRAHLGRDTDAELVGVLARQTGGNPLLLGEGLRSLEARGLLGKPRKAGEWERLLPRGIRHLLLEKIRRLSPGAGLALGCAAALGSEVDPGLLARCLPDASALDAQLAEALDAALLLPGTAGRGPRFTHALVRESLYEELVPAGSARSAVHARILAELERGAQGPDDALSERAHHACEAVPVAPSERAIELAARAGEQAARKLDFERALAWYERALALLASARRDDPALHATLRLGLGDAQTRALGLERARATYREAADFARACARSDLLVAAALGFAHRPSSSGQGDAETIALLEEALSRFGAGDEAMRIRVLSRLAVELRYADHERAEGLMQQAIAAARRLGDPHALAQALDDCSFVTWSVADSEGWIALNAEIVRVAHASGDLELVLAGQRGLVAGSLELGDVTAVEREIRACARTAEALRTPWSRWLCAALRATASLREGDLGTAERCVGEALALGDGLDSREVWLEQGTQLVYLRFEQGRAAEIEAAVRLQVERFPETTAWRAALARMLLVTGRASEARHELEQLARARFADVPRDRGFLPTLAMSVEVAAAVGDAHSAAQIESLLLPHARLHVVAGSGLLYYGSVAHALGLAAATGARHEEAVAHFEQALAAEEAVGANLWAARTRVECARVLVARGTPSDRPRAANLVGHALKAARQRGWADVEQAGREFEAALWGARPPGRRRYARSG